MGQPVFTLSCPDHCRTNGDLVVGTVNLHIGRAKRKQVVAVKVGLACEIQSHQVTLSEVLDEEKIVWKQYDTEREIEEIVGSDLVHTDKEVTIIPFSFRIPEDGVQTRGSARYYLRVKGQRKCWYMRTISVERVFPVFIS